VSRVVISGPLRPRELAALCERVRVQVGHSPGAAIVCDVSALPPADVGTVGALARLELTARRLGGTLELDRPSPQLCELLDLCGLAGVLRLEPGRQPEEREQPLGVEERVEMGDPPVL
jgi:ABC-type transporter Mla MlaB component